jgi:hypothetical protein
MFWERSKYIKRQDKQGYCDVSKYHFLYLSDYIYIYIYIYLYCLSLSLCQSKIYAFVLRATSWRLRRPPWKMLLLVALHQNKCGVLCWERSKYMKRQEEQGNCDVSKYCTVLLSSLLYILLPLCLCHCLYLKTMPLSSRQHPADWEDPLGSCCCWSPFIKINVV